MSKSRAIPPVRAPQLHHAAVFAESLDRSIAFYRDALGLQVEAQWKEITVGRGKNAKTHPLIGAFLADGTGRVIEVFQKPASSRQKPDERPINHFAFLVPDVEAAVEKALAAGARLDRPPTHARTGPVRGEAAFVRGPDGELIELARFDTI